LISQDIGIALKFSLLSKSELYEMIESLSRKINQDMKDGIRRTWPKNDWTESILDAMEFNKEKIRERFELINGKFTDENITLCTLEGHLILPLNITLDKSKTILPRQNILAGNFMVSCGVGVRIT